eukprot:c8072_g1_i1 orf=1-474(-)
MSGRKGRGVLHAQARTLKKVWRRVQVNSSQLVEQLLQHLSLGGAGACMNVYERLEQPSTWSAAPSDDEDRNQYAVESPAVASCSAITLAAACCKAPYRPTLSPDHRHHRRRSSSHNLSLNFPQDTRPKTSKGPSSLNFPTSFDSPDIVATSSQLSAHD